MVISPFLFLLYLLCQKLLQCISCEAGEERDQIQVQKADLGGGVGWVHLWDGKIAGIKSASWQRGLVPAAVSYVIKEGSALLVFLHGEGVESVHLPSGAQTLALSCR